jgi:hypothetical protein
MNVISMMRKINFITNPMVRESSLPHFSFSGNDAAKFMRVSAFDQLNRALNRYVGSGSQQ